MTTGDAPEETSPQFVVWLRSHTDALCRAWTSRPERRHCGRRGHPRGLVGIGPAKVSTDRQNSAYSVLYQPSELWIVDGMR